MVVATAAVVGMVVAVVVVTVAAAKPKAIVHIDAVAAAGVSRVAGRRTLYTREEVFVVDGAAVVAVLEEELLELRWLQEDVEPL